MLKELWVEPELIQLCRAKNWASVGRRSVSHPEEARPTPEAYNGGGTTALAISVRSGAPLVVIQALIDADARQLSVVHKFSGSILHEALIHQTPSNVLSYLFEAVIRHERVHRGRDKSYVSVVGRKGPLQRTVLHCLVVRMLQEVSNDGDCSRLWLLFRSILSAYPREFNEARDADGSSPLELALLWPGDIQNSDEADIIEAYVFRMVQLTVTFCPSAATTAQHREQVSVGLNPLAYAILYRRSEKTIRLLLEVHHKLGVNDCLTLVNEYREVPLHLAASLKSPVPLLKDLLAFEPSAVRAQDMYNLTPLDWIWIRHVVDWCYVTEPRTSRVNLSTRRYISAHFAAWHERTSESMQQNEFEIGWRNSLLRSLLMRMKLFLPAAANAAMPCKREEPWPLLQAACFISCPLAIVRMAYSQEPNAISTRDAITGRLPLHYAVSRTGYHAAIPVGVSREVRTLSEPSPATEVASMFVQATRIADIHNQLPLHVAIDTAKRSQDEEGAVVLELVDLYPESLERRDGTTKLYPFMQAAVGPDALLGMTFVLLVKHPTLVSNCIERLSNE